MMMPALQLPREAQGRSLLGARRAWAALVSCFAALGAGGCQASDEAPSTYADAADGAAPIEDGGPDGPSESSGGGCTPATCATLGATCGSAPDGCGGKAECGNCTGGLKCGGDGANRCGTADCTAKTCAMVEASCGFASDGCSEALDCGPCPVPYTCGGGGKAGQCGCTPKTCAQLGLECGSAPDGCDGTVECGACAPGQTCGANGQNKCGIGSCAPKTCVQRGASCGFVSDGCSEALDCGSCSGFDTCGGGGAANQCGCTPKTCVQLSTSCGKVGHGCGGVVDCGSCPDGMVCGGGGTPGMCSCTCSLPHATTRCIAGVCSILACDAGWDDCNAVAADGCEADLSSDTGNCGVCGNDCSVPNASVSCLGGSCSFDGCWGAFADCDAAAPGCETVITEDLSNCGSCGHACTPGFSCVQGGCECSSDTDCDTGGGGTCDSDYWGFRWCQCGTVTCDRPCDAAGTACQ